MVRNIWSWNETLPDLVLKYLLNNETGNKPNEWKIIEIIKTTITSETSRPSYIEKEYLR